MRISDWSSDVCSSDLASYEHFIDREGLSDSFTLRADYLSPRFANLGNIDGINTTSATVTGQYSRQFTMRLTATASASYLKGRGDVAIAIASGRRAFIGSTGAGRSAPGSITPNSLRPSRAGTGSASISASCSSPTTAAAPRHDMRAATI